MAYIQDSTQSFTITLSALLEGLGLINWMGVWNVTTGMTYEWSAGTWTATPEATEGDSLSIDLEVINDGAVTDTLFGEFISAQVTPVEPLIQEMSNVGVGVLDGVSWTFVMPQSAVNMTINAGHVE